MKIKSENNIKSAINYLSFIILFLSLVLSPFLMISSAMEFQAGRHNVDLGSNMRFLEEKFDTKLVDEGSDGELRTGSELIHLGFKQMEENLKSTRAYSFIFGYLTGIFLVILLSTSPLINSKKNKK